MQISTCDMLPSQQHALKGALLLYRSSCRQPKAPHPWREPLPSTAACHPAQSRCAVGLTMHVGSALKL